MMRNSDWG